MKSPLATKLGTIALLTVLLLIPLYMIKGIILERQALRENVVRDIARSSSSNQHLTGPVFVIPYKKKVRAWKVRADSSRYRDEFEVAGNLYFLPETFALDGKMQTEVRARGIYEARLYHANNQITGRFDIPRQYGVTDDLADYQFEKPFLAVGISDIRGIGNALKITVNGDTHKFKAGSQVDKLGNGVHVSLPSIDPLQHATFEFAFNLMLHDTSQFDITPIGRESQIKLSADWPHPSFVGEFLPAEHKITNEGFDARWQTSLFSTNMDEVMQACLTGAKCEQFNARHFGVSLVNPVDQYLKSERAIKYALLFLVLTFAGFFIFEVLKRLAVHPVQYGLVGMALAVFYLMLLSLSEHIGFGVAYALSSAGCVLLIGFYVSHVLKSMSRGLSFSAGLAALYALLYGLLSAEDYALLMGSLLVFGVLGVVMIATRKLDWYGVGKPESLGQ